MIITIRQGSKGAFQVLFIKITNIPFPPCTLQYYIK
jgi:hypothetical protein